MAATQPIRSGVKTFGDGDAWISWWLLPRVTDDQAREFCEDKDLCSYYAGPGLPFERGAGWRHSLSYTLVQQFGGYDV
jgi:hypothetical protein